jgi:hypothetical protein
MMATAKEKKVTVASLPVLKRVAATEKKKKIEKKEKEVELPQQQQQQQQPAVMMKIIETPDAKDTSLTSIITAVESIPIIMVSEIPMPGNGAALEGNDNDDEWKSCLDTPRYDDEDDGDRAADSTPVATPSRQTVLYNASSGGGRGGDRDDGHDGEKTVVSKPNLKFSEV